MSQERDIDPERITNQLMPESYNSRTIYEQHLARWMRAVKFMGIGAGTGLVAGLALGLAVSSQCDLLAAKYAITLSMGILGTVVGMAVSSGIEEITRTN